MTAQGELRRAIRDKISDVSAKAEMSEANADWYLRRGHLGSFEAGRWAQRNADIAKRYRKALRRLWLALHKA
jgi:hypothetical protein